MDILAGVDIKMRKAQKFIAGSCFVLAMNAFSAEEGRNEGDPVGVVADAVYFELLPRLNPLALHRVAQTNHTAHELIAEFLEATDSATGRTRLENHRLPIVGRFRTSGTPLTPVRNGNRLYVPNSPEGTVDVFEFSHFARGQSAGLELIETLQVGLRPRTPIVVGNRLYVVNSQDATMMVFDTQTFDLISTVDTPAWPLRPALIDDEIFVFGMLEADGLAYSPSDETITPLRPYLTNPGEVYGRISFRRSRERLANVAGPSNSAEVFCRLVGEEEEIVVPIDVGGTNLRAEFESGEFLIKLLPQMGQVQIAIGTDEEVVREIQRGELAGFESSFPIQIDENYIFLVDRTAQEILVAYLAPEWSL